MRLSRVRRRCLCRCGREELFTDLANDASFSSQYELCCVVVKMEEVTLKKGSGALVPPS